MRQIDENLRRVYRDDEPPTDVPDRFKVLLEKLKEKEQRDG
ncbi:NepR family anti-sigma factor [Palleronia caenipelagi]|uniref:Regulator n=1 Tax=Palleronia caenipelagi TaxID=2489174 RepID=A0A547Q5M2_9RHOB|nr:NepR family anti-sigma factor [Palleronia caenipelagi]TRD21684.1 regulator [Palleronia caenipelagi]